MSGAGVHLRNAQLRSLDEVTIEDRRGSYPRVDRILRHSVACEIASRCWKSSARSIIRRATFQIVIVFCLRARWKHYNWRTNVELSLPERRRRDASTCLAQNGV